MDRDGTINVEKGHVFRRQDFEYIPGSLDALRLVSERNVPIFIVTNQAGIAKDIYTEQDFADLTSYMCADMSEQGVRIADVLYCPHHPEAVNPAYRRVCECRKPGVGLLRGVIERDGLDPRCLAIIGDKNSDVEAGRALGIRSYLVETGHGADERLNTRADFVAKDLGDAVHHLLMSHPPEPVSLEPQYVDTGSRQ